MKTSRDETATGRGAHRADRHDPRSAGPRPPFDEKSQPADHPADEEAMTVKPDYGATSYVGAGRLAGSVALVTGGDSGIGRAVVLAFAREGADVAIACTERELRDAEISAQHVRDAGRRAHVISCDLARPEDCARIVEETHAKLGALDVLVNNAAFQSDAVERFEDLHPERIRRTFAVNIEAMFHTTRAALKYLKPGGVVINTASIQAYQPTASILDYAATKGAIVAFSKGLAGELAKRGLRCNVVAPGPVWTPLITQWFEGDKLRNFGATNPMGRPAQPVELAPAYVFLASDESRFVNGEVLGVTGGKLLA